MSLPTEYQQFVFKRTYSRWLNDEGRRESWDETVDRFKEFFSDRVPEGLEDWFESTIEGIRNTEAMPSMRAFWTAGDALNFDNICGFNCAYTVIEKPKDFAEILYILMNGTGVGFSTEKKYVNKLPKVWDIEFEDRREATTDPFAPKEDPDIVVGDSKQGWAEAFHELLKQLYKGHIPCIDYSEIRAKGEPLKTFGGRASGPQPLKDLFDFAIETFQEAKGRRLTTLEAYDLVTMTAEIVVAGGVRRSATINLSDLDDEKIATAKEGKFWEEHPHRALSNNSALYHGKPDEQTFMEEWVNLMKGGNGERGIVNRQGLKKHLDQREGVNRELDHDFGVNPCGETILRPRQFCNLTEAVVRPDDNLTDLKEKVMKATFLGMLQGTLTDYNFIDDEWAENQKEERLLGVSLTGLRDHPVIGEKSSTAKEWLTQLRILARDTAERLAKEFEVNVPTTITTVKPSGTVSQVVNSASGIHPRFSRYYIRRVRVASDDPIADLLAHEGIPYEPEVGETIEDADTLVFEFPVETPETSVRRGEKTAIEQLEYWKMVKEAWTEHNPSQTIYIKEGEWVDVAKWIYDNFEMMTGISFLPYDGGNYELAPYEVITKSEYEDRKEKTPSINWDNLAVFEKVDRTKGSQEYACTGGECSIV